MKKSIVIVLLLVLISTTYFMFRSNSQSENQPDISRLKNISRDIFDLYDRGNLKIRKYYSGSVVKTKKYEIIMNHIMPFLSI